jgi:protein-disulfide isomerase
MQVAKTRRRPKSQSKKSAISPMIIAAVVGAAILIVGGLILISNQGKPGSDAASDVALFPTLGDPNAAVVIEEYSDFG